ncbi:MAG: ATP-dependent helicase HrpB, partial [Rhodospirillales bacterium]|nr:ATP-dependent helicase HrpB [Rhodospirillales bacterium]
MPALPPPSLPVATILPALRAALDAGRNALLLAPPGSGKTTLVPPALLDAPWRGNGAILVLEPRRLAARAAATRVAALRGEAPGGLVGYRTRLDAAVSAATRIVFFTEGLLIRRLIADPALDGVAAVILDEVHERSQDADLALALLGDLQRGLRPDLRLVAMSATADAARLAPLLAAETLASEVAPHPLAIHHAARDLAAPRELPEAMAAAIRAALAAHPGDLLAFLPGMAEIRRAEAALSGIAPRVLALHGDLPPAAQDAALTPDPSGRRRVILASPIAETSLTVPGVAIVVDGGYRRAPRFDPASGLTRLALVRISRAAAAQRAGRAAREGPGVAIRLWTEAAHRGLAAQDRPEILDSDLAPLRLAAAAWEDAVGTTLAGLRFPDAPPAGALAAAGELLRDLGALDAQGRLTEAGAGMAALGAHPRLAAMMRAAASPGEAARAADLAALLEERDPLRARADADLAPRLAALAGEAPDDADRAAIARIRRAAGQYRARLGLPRNLAPEGDPARLIAAAYPDRIAARRDQVGNFRLSGGGGAALAPADPLARAKLLAVATLGQNTGAARIRLAAPLDPDDLPPALAARVTRETETAFDPASGAVLARTRTRLGALVLADRTAPADAAQSAGALAVALAGAAWSKLSWPDRALQLRARVARMAALEPDAGWPDFSDSALRGSVGEWL